MCQDVPDLTCASAPPELGSAMPPLVRISIQEGTRLPGGSCSLSSRDAPGPSRAFGSPEHGYRGPLLPRTCSPGNSSRPDCPSLKASADARGLVFVAGPPGPAYI